MWIKIPELEALPFDFAGAHRIFRQWLDEGRIEHTFPRFIRSTEGGSETEDKVLRLASALCVIEGLDSRDRALLITLALALGTKIQPSTERRGAGLFTGRPEFPSNLDLNRTDRLKLDYVFSWVRSRHMGLLTPEDVRVNEGQPWFRLALAWFMAGQMIAGNVTNKADWMQVVQ